MFQINKCDAFLALFNSEFIQIKKENKDNLNLFYSNYFFLNFYVKTFNVTYFEMNGEFLYSNFV